MNLSKYLFLAALASCGSNKSSGDDSKRQGSIGGREYVKVSDNSNVFKEPIGEIQSNKNYTLIFSIEDKGTFELISHCDKNLQNGVEIKFSRNKNVLTVQSTINGKSSAPKDVNLNASHPIAVKMDVHNDEAKTHLLIWNMDEKSPTEDNALFNSNVDAQTTGKGKGNFWGFKINDASLAQANISDALSSH